MTEKKLITFWKFFSQFFVPMQRLQIPLKPEHHAVCDALQAVALGQSEKKIVVVNIPPRFGKTKMMEALVCWQLGLRAGSHVIYTSYGADLAADSIRYISLVVNRDWFVSLFGEVMGDISQAERFTTRENGEVIGVGMEGPITGKGAGLKEAGNGFIVIDDPMKPGDAISRLKVEAANFWFTNTLLSRRNSPHVPVIICAQRVGRNDLCGYVLRNFGAEVLHIKIPVFDRRGRNIMPETKSNEELQALKLADNFSFQAQFMQEPIAKGGNIIKTDQFKFYADAPESMRFDWKCVTCDTAQKTKEANDYTVMQCWGCLAGAAYLIDQIRGKVEAPDLITLAMEFWRRHDGDGMRQFFIEDKVSGTGLIQTLIRERIPVQPLQRSKDKFMRLSDALPYITAGAVYLPKGAAWLPAFLAECEDFRADMSHDHDDQVDCMVDGILAVKGIGVSILDVI